MGNISRIYIEVAVDGKGGIKVLKQIGTESKKTGKKGKKSFQDMSRSTGDFNKKIGLTRKLVGGMGALFTGWGLSRIIRSMAQFVSLAEEQRKSVAGMETAMRSMGRYTPQTSKALQDYAASLQQVTNFGDEATLEGTKFLMTYREITDELMFRSIGTMQDLAALMKGDLVGAANMLGKASMGMTGELRRVGITVDSATYKAEGYLGVLKAIEAQVSGQAAAMRDPWKQLSNAVSDSKEALGGFIGLAFEDYAKDMIRLLPELSKSWQEVAESIKETHRVELEYMIQSLEAQLAGKGIVADLPGTMAPDFTIFGMTGEEEKALQEKLERYKGFLEDLKKASDETIKTTAPGPDAQALKDHKALMKEVEKAQKEFQDALIIPSGTYEIMEQQLRRGIGADITIKDAEKIKEAYAAMYDYLEFEADGYYDWRLRQIRQETDAHAATTGDQVMAHQMYIEKVKELDKERLAAAENNNQYLIDLSQRTAEAMEQNFSDFYFDVMRGEFDDLGDYAEAMLMSIQRATADVMGQMTKEALFGGGASKSPGLISGIGTWIGNMGDGGSTYAGAGTYGVSPGDINWHARGGTFGPNEWIGVGESGPEIIYTGDRGGQVIPSGTARGDVSIQVNVNNYGEPLETTEPPEVRFDGQKYVVDVHMDKMLNNRSYRQANKQAMR